MTLPLRTADTMSDAIALSSPSGRMSKRARNAAARKLGEALFGPGGATREELMGSGPKPPSEAEYLRQHAARLREFAARGMSPKRFRREADRADARARALDGRSER